MRKRWKQFCSEFNAELTKSPDNVEAAATRAAQRVFMGSQGQMSEKQARNHARALLRNPNIQEGIANYFAVVTDKGLPELAEQIMKFAFGGLTANKTYIMQNKDGTREVITVNEELPPSESAAKFAFSLMIPKPAKQVQIDQRTMVARITVEGEKPPITPRLLETKVELNG